MRKIIFIFSILFCMPSFAHNCILYKITPTIELDKPEYKTSVFLSQERLDMLHGHVEANLVNNYDLILETFPIDGGYCVVLKRIDALFGFDKFDIEINKEHELNSCSYKAVLNHEEKHINVYINIIEEFKSDIFNSLFTAADSVMPIFIENKSEIEQVFEKLNQEFSSHPDLLLISQKVNAAQEIRNKQIDQNENNSELYSCYN